MKDVSYAISQNESLSLLYPAILKALEENGVKQGARVLDLGCGRGAVSRALSAAGYQVTGVDIDNEAVAEARRCYPQLDLRQGSGEDDLKEQMGSFDAVVSIEVIEHVSDPVTFVKNIHSVLNPGGLCIMTAPYHGYVKNLIISLRGGWDCHLDPFWKAGHIKFWSERTFRKLIVESCFDIIVFRRLGRIPMLAKSMMVQAVKSGSE